MEKDKRIKLIKNIENRKILFSKSMAALNANGKYIVQLDQDDMFLRDDLFNILYYEAEINNLDLVQMRELVAIISRIKQELIAKEGILYLKKIRIIFLTLKNNLFSRILYLKMVMFFFYGEC